MEDLSLHVLDVAENALAAGAGSIEVRIIEEPKKDVLTIEIQDDGCGMDDEMVRRALDPFYTTKPGKRVGLGLPLFAQAAREAGGGMEVKAEPGEGVLVRATFRLSHPDLKPLGNMHESVAALAIAHPAVTFVLEHRRNGAVVSQWTNAEPRPTRETGSC